MLTAPVRIPVLPFPELATCADLQQMCPRVEGHDAVNDTMVIDPDDVALPLRVAGCLVGKGYVIPASCRPGKVGPHLVAVDAKFAKGPP